MRQKTVQGGVFPLRKGRFRWPALLLVLLVVAPVWGADYQSGDFRLSLGTTLSYGLTWRVEDRDTRIIGLANGGTAYSVNGDDGNLNYDKGLVSNAAKATVEIELSYKNFGAFVRGFGFYDYENQKGQRARLPLSDGALDRVGSRAELRDAFLWFKADLGPVPAQLRVGQQVLSWGESTFIQGGINTINPVDVSALRVPGAELRDALLPVGLVWASFGFSKNTALEMFYQYDWEETIIDPPGSYFSTNDFVGVGGTHVFLGFGEPSDIAPSPFFIQPPLTRPFLGVPRGPDQRADDEGQYGAALRWFVPALGNTELGFYFMNYHSRLPVVNGRAGTLAGAIAASKAGPAAAARVYAFYGVKPGTNPTVDAAAARAGQAAATDAYASTASYYISYPEDIKLYGISFNTQLGNSGIALQGEVSYRKDAPVLVDDVELLFAALSPISPGLAATNQVRPGGVSFGEDIPGFIRGEVVQFQATATKAFGPGLGADQSVLVFEGAVTNLRDAPSKSVLRLEGPGTYTSGNPIHSQPGGAHAGKAFEEAEHFADATSWGYRLAGRLDYNNAIGAFNLSPRFAWQHDVSGISPAPGGNFLEGFKALTVGVTATYQNAFEIDLSYTSYSGGDRYNLINDRDFIATSVKYTF